MDEQIEAMKIWTFSRERIEGYWIPRWTYRCNEADKSGVHMLATVGPIDLHSCKRIAAKSGWSEDQPTQIIRTPTTESSVYSRITAELDNLESAIKKHPKAGIQFS